MAVGASSGLSSEEKDALTGALCDLGAQLSEARLKIDSLEAAVAHNDERASELEATVRAQATMLADAQSQIKTRDAAMKQSTAEVSRIQKENKKALVAQARAFENETQTLRDQLSSAQGELEKLRAAVADRAILEATHKKLRASHEALVAAHELIRMDHGTLQHEYGAKAAEFEKERSELARKLRLARQKLIIRSVWFRAQLARLERVTHVALQMDAYLAPELTCKTCLNVFKHPHVLECGHSMCAQCIQVNSIDGSVRCSECNRQCSAECPANFTLDSVVSRYHWWVMSLRETKLHRDRIDNQSGNAGDPAATVGDIYKFLSA